MPSVGYMSPLGMSVVPTLNRVYNDIPDLFLVRVRLPILDDDTRDHVHVVLILVVLPSMVLRVVSVHILVQLNFESVVDNGVHHKNDFHTAGDVRDAYFPSVRGLA